MIGQDSNGYRLVPGRNFFQNRFHHAGIQVFDGFYFQHFVAFVAGFVAGFDVQVYEIVGTQCIDSSLRFSFVVGVVKSGSAFHFNHFQASVHANPFDQIHC